MVGYHVPDTMVIWLTLSTLLVAAGLVVVVSLNILRKGWMYQRLNPESRPRRWVLASLLVLFAVFVVWFPVWLFWPQTIISKVLTIVFGTVWLVVGLTLRWLTGLVDYWIVRKGWQLR